MQRNRLKELGLLLACLLLATSGRCTMPEPVTADSPSSTPLCDGDTCDTPVAGSHERVEQHGTRSASVADADTDAAESNKVLQQVPAGHLRKLGEHGEPVVGGITELDYAIGSQDFYEQFVLLRRPVVFRGATRTWPATKHWSNETYLREMYGDVLFDVEQGKLFEKALNTRKTMRMSEFLATYKDLNVYLDSPFPQSAMMKDLEVPSFFQCGDQKFSSLHLLFSSGGTSSVLHLDGYQNFLAMFAGIKVVYAMEPKYMQAAYIDQLSEFPGLSPINPEAVDLVKFPLFKDVPFHKIVLNVGDILYIPQGWLHQVRSYGCPNIAVSMWFNAFPFLEDYDYVDSLSQEDAFVRSLKAAPQSLSCLWQEIPLVDLSGVDLAKARRDRAHVDTPTQTDSRLLNKTVLFQHVSLHPPSETLFAGSDDRYIYAFDAETGSVRWMVETKEDTGSTCAFNLEGDAIYCGADDGFLRKIQVRDGLVVCVMAADGPIISSPAVDKEGTVYFGSLDGFVYAMFPSCALKWVKEVRAQVWSSPAISEDKRLVYIGSQRNKSNILALNMEDGTRAWRFTADAGIVSSPALNHGASVVYFCDSGRNLYALDAENGKLVYKLRVRGDGGISSSPKVSRDGFLYVATNSGRFVALNASSGELIWDKGFGASERGTSSSPLVAPDGVVYMADGNGFVYSFNRHNGSLLWQTRIGSSIFFSSPRLSVSGKLYVGSVDGPLFALRAETGDVVWSAKTGGPFVGTARITREFEVNSE